MIKKAIFLSSVFLLASACSDEGKDMSEKKINDDHVWKEQTQSIDKAKAVERILEDAAAEQRKSIDE